MHLLITEIEWDTEGESIEECALPKNVIVIDAGNELDHPDLFDPDDLNEEISNLLSDAFGFCHYGFQVEKLTKQHNTHGGGGLLLDRLGIINASH